MDECESSKNLQKIVHVRSLSFGELKISQTDIFSNELVAEADLPIDEMSDAQKYEFHLAIASYIQRCIQERKQISNEQVVVSAWLSFLIDILLNPLDAQDLIGNLEEVNAIWLTKYSRRRVNILKFFFIFRILFSKMLDLLSEIIKKFSGLL